MRYITFFIMFLFVASFVTATELSTKATEDNLVPEFLRALAVVDNNVEHCYQADESYAVYHNGLWWAWLAPVATTNWGGQGIDPDASLIGDGWRNVADETEWALRPDATAFGQTKCAAELFFSPAPHCDWSDPYYVDAGHPDGYLTYYIDGSVSEFWVVHDDCGGREIPEFGLLGLMIAIIGGLGVFAYARKN